MNDAVEATNKKVNPRCVDHVVENNNYTTIFFKPTFHLTHNKTSPIADILRKYDLFDKRAKDKFIPRDIFETTNKNIYAFLKALFSGDGCAYYNESRGRKYLKISYSSASVRLIYDVQRLLNKVGIISYIRKVKNKNNNAWYNLDIGGKENLIKFVSKIGFINKRKNDIAKHGAEQIKSIKCGWKKYELTEEICYMSIKNIKKTKVEKVYDIEVPDEHNFTANGMIVHNSIEEDSDMIMFLHETGTVASDESVSYIDIIVAKNRNGRVGMYKFVFEKPINRFIQRKDYEHE